MNNTSTAFPQFSPVSIDAQGEFTAAAKMDKLYSDFNFTSAYVWDLDGTHAYSIHNGNLILQLADYVTSEPVFSILGTNNIDNIIDEVLSYAKEKHQIHELQLLPEQTINAISDESKFSIEEDRDNFDYIYSFEELSKLEGNTYKSKRHAANRCERDYKIIIEEFDGISSDIRNGISELMQEWTTYKNENGKQDEDSEHELASLERVFDNFNQNENLKLNIAWHEGVMVGFAIDELEDNKYVLSHYCKTMPTIVGLTEFFNRELAKLFFSRGFLYWNWEQDTGNEKLKRVKMSYRPIHFNKKYTLSLKN